MGEKNISLLVVSCYSYADVLKLLIRKLDAIYFFSIPFDSVYLATDIKSKEVDYKKMHFDEVIEGDAWGERVRNALKKINTEYCMVLLDDYIPTKPVNLDMIDSLLKVAEDFDCIYLTSVFSDIGSSKKVAQLDGYVRVPDELLYRVNSTVGIWKKDSLLKVLSDDDSPWEWEAFAGLGKKSKSMKFAAPIDETSQVYSYSYKTGGAVYRGAWVYSALTESGFDEDFIKSLDGRPVIRSLDRSKRPLSWKINFLRRGYKMVGLGVVKFISYSYIKKIKNKFGK